MSVSANSTAGTASHHGPGHVHHEPRNNPNVTLAVISIGVLAFALLQSMVSPALTTMRHDLHASESGVAWVLTAYMLSAAVATPLIGRLGDIYGKKRLMVVALAMLAVGCVLAAVASSLSLLIVARVIQGAGGGLLPLSFGIVRDEFPAERVPGSIGVVSALVGLGAGFGLVIAGIIVQHLDYHWLFWIPLIMVALSLTATVAFVPESPQRSQGRINWLGAALLSVGLVAVLYAISQTSSWGWGSAKTLGLIVAGLVVLALWVFAELRSSSPLVDMRTMAIRGVWTTNLLAVAVGVALMSAFLLLPQFAQTPRELGFGFGASVTGGGLFLLPTALMMMVVGALTGRLEARFGARFCAILGCLINAGGFVLLLAAHNTKLPVYISSALLGAGVGLTLAAIPNLIVRSVSHEQTGMATGMNAVARTVGQAFGGQLAATFLATAVTAAGMPTVRGYNHGFLMGLIAAIVAVGVACLVPLHGKLETDEVVQGVAAATEGAAAR